MFWFFQAALTYFLPQGLVLDTTAGFLGSEQEWQMHTGMGYLTRWMIGEITNIKVIDTMTR